MVVRVHRTGNEFSFVLPPQAVEDLRLVDGSAIEIQPAAEDTAPASVRYASVEEALEAHRKLEPKYAPAYRELAK